jgi:hypothetical protein
VPQRDHLAQVRKLRDVGAHVVVQRQLARSASSAMAKAVNCLDVDPMFVRVSTVNGMPCVRFAMPYARWNTISPFRTTATTAPGVSGRVVGHDPVHPVALCLRLLGRWER